MGRVIIVNLLFDSVMLVNILLVRNDKSSNTSISLFERSILFKLSMPTKSISVMFSILFPDKSRE